MESVINISGYKRIKTSKVNIGGIELGGSNPIRLQTMTTTNTNNIEDTVNQSIRSINTGSHYIRITTQGVKEAESFGLIKRELRRLGYLTPLIADIHFNPLAALEAAKYADKIRINPGNYADKSKASAITFSDQEYGKELERVEERFLDLLNRCKQNDVAIRVGVNQGSLSQRIMSRYGDTPVGMAHSAMEFLRICRNHNYHKLVVSMKSSNTRVMVQATRFLVKFMRDEGMDYPLHLGVTEAGEGEDGRIKSAVGIGTLLVDGIGDTIRVSLTEEPENEIPVAKTLVHFFEHWQHNPKIILADSVPINPFEFKKRETYSSLNIGSNNPPVVVANLSLSKSVNDEILKLWGWTFDTMRREWISQENAADYIYIGNRPITQIPEPKRLPLIGRSPNCSYSIIDKDTYLGLPDEKVCTPLFVEVVVNDFDKVLLNKLRNSKGIVLILKGTPYQFFSLRNIFFQLVENKIDTPAILSLSMNELNAESFQLITASIAGPLFIDGMGDGIMITCTDAIPQNIIKSTAFGILQAARVRISKTEFISCPGCGRTLFNLNETLKRVKEQTAHLKGLKIGVMGCIVNGPGEMADADYGYVGSGHGRVTLYHRKQVVKRNIPEDQAVDQLISLIKENGQWIEKRT
jgi:(E)-4-hydroxy-3-methylbut-2-enyl-diphosphate synthase